MYVLLCPRLGGEFLSRIGSAHQGTQLLLQMQMHASINYFTSQLQEAPQQQACTDLSPWHGTTLMQSGSVKTEGCVCQQCKGQHA